MSKYIARAKELRAIVTPHYNCGQAVLLPFTEEMGLPNDLVMRFAANFGGGMKLIERRTNRFRKIVFFQHVAAEVEKAMLKFRAAGV